MSVLGLTDAKAYLNITTDDYDTELAGVLDSAEAAVSQRIGPLSATPLTKRVPGYGYSLHLPIYPAISLTSVTAAGGSTALTLADLYLDQDSGAVSFTGGGFFSASAYDVVYVAGRSPVSADLLMLVRRVLKALWLDQLGAGVRPGATGETPTAPSMWPPSVLELLAPYELLPGLA